MKTVQLVLKSFPLTFLRLGDIKRASPISLSHFSSISALGVSAATESITIVMSIAPERMRFSVILMLVRESGCEMIKFQDQHLVFCIKRSKRVSASIKAAIPPAFELQLWRAVLMCFTEDSGPYDLSITATWIATYLAQRSMQDPQSLQHTSTTWRSPIFITVPLPYALSSLSASALALSPFMLFFIVCHFKYSS
jgi:hypothetical protein